MLHSSPQSLSALYSNITCLHLPKMLEKKKKLFPKMVVCTKQNDQTTNLSLLFKHILKNPTKIPSNFSKSTKVVSVKPTQFFGSKNAPSFFRHTSKGSGATSTNPFDSHRAIFQMCWVSYTGTNLWWKGGNSVMP